MEQPEEADELLVAATPMLMYPYRTSSRPRAGVTLNGAPRHTGMRCFLAVETARMETEALSLDPIPRERALVALHRMREHIVTELQ